MMEKDLNLAMVKKGPNKGSVPLPAKESLELLRSLVDAAKEHGNTREEERTRRAQIEADLKRDIAKIKVQRKILETILQNTFSERRDTVDRMFERLDRALSEDRNDVAIQALSSIEGIVKSSPLESLLAARNTLEDKESILEI